MDRSPPPPRPRSPLKNCRQNVLTIATLDTRPTDVGRLIWASPALPGARHDAGAAKEHGIPAALSVAGVMAFADSAYHGAGATVRVPYRRSRQDRATRRFVRRALSGGQKAVNRAHSALRAPGERAIADLKSWRILRKIRSSPADATRLVNAVQTVMLNS